MPRRFGIIHCQNNSILIFLLEIFLIWNNCYATPTEIIPDSEVSSDITQQSNIQTTPLSSENPLMSDLDIKNGHLHSSSNLPFNSTSYLDGNFNDSGENQTIPAHPNYSEEHFVKGTDYNNNFSSTNWSALDIRSKSETPHPHNMLPGDLVVDNISDSSEASQIFIEFSTQSDLVPNYAISMDDYHTSTLPSSDALEDKTTQKHILELKETTNSVPHNTVKMSKVSTHETTTSEEFTISTLFVSSDNNSLLASRNATNHIIVQSKDKHMLKIIIAVISSLCALSIGLLVGYYRWRLAGRRRKVYFSHHGEQPKDFADNTGVRSPVLLPDEIEMQAGQSTSHRLRRAVLLGTDSLETEMGPDIIVRSPTAQPSGDAQTITATPPPPPYRTPPPYLSDMIIENIHAL